MTLRTAGLIAGVIGVILLLVAGVAQLVKPAPEANPTTNVSATVVVVPPEVIALSPDGDFTFTGTGTMASHTARTQDVSAWTASRTFVTVTGLTDWEILSTTTVEPSPSPSPSASGSPSPSASPTKAPAKTPAPSPSASASPSGTASGSPSPTPTVAPTPLGSQDIWRETESKSATFKVAAASVPVGLSLVVESLGDGTVDSVSLHLPRTVDDAWISQVMWWGIGLALLGLIALIALFIDVRPAQSKGEEWLASRAAVGSGKKEPKPGSRREKRAAGAAIPMVDIPAEPPTTGSIPVVPTTGSVPEVEADPAAFEPPAKDDQEERS